MCRNHSIKNDIHFLAKSADKMEIMFSNPIVLEKLLHFLDQYRYASRFPYYNFFQVLSQDKGHINDMPVQPETDRDIKVPIFNLTNPIPNCPFKGRKKKILPDTVSYSMLVA